MRFDIKTVSEANQREHWAAKSKRKKSQQHDLKILWQEHTRKYERKHGKPEVTIPAIITFTRFSCKQMDADNLAGAFKHVQDQLARELGIDDGDGSVTWVYKQERTPKREHYFTVNIETEKL